MDGSKGASAAAPAGIEVNEGAPALEEFAVYLLAQVHVLARKQLVRKLGELRALRRSAMSEVEQLAEAEAALVGQLGKLPHDVAAEILREVNAAERAGSPQRPLQFECDCGREARGGPYPRVHAAACAYVQPRGVRV